MLIQGGKISSGRFSTVSRGRRVLDQLHQVVLVDDLAGRDRDVLADPEFAVIRHADAELALAALEVGQQVRQALQQVLAAGLGGLAQHLRIGQQEVGGAHRIDELPGVEIDLLRRLRLHAIDAADHVLEEAGGQQVGLLDEVEDLVVAPGLVLEAAVLRVLGDDRGGPVLAHHPPGGILPEGEVVLPEAELRLHQPGRIGHEPGRHLQEGAADVQRIGRGATAPLRLALEEIRHDPLAALGHLGHGAGYQCRVGQPELRALGRFFFGHGPPYAAAGRASSLLYATPRLPLPRPSALTLHWTGGSRTMRGWRLYRAGLGLLAVSLAGCEIPKEVNPVEIYRTISGEADAGRLPPPGMDRPRPSLGSVPPRPERPPPEARDAISAALALNRAESRDPLGRRSVPAPPSAASPGDPLMPAGAAAPGRADLGACHSLGRPGGRPGAGQPAAEPEPPPRRRSLPRRRPCRISHRPHHRPIC